MTRRRSGFSLIELMVAMTILSIVLLGVGRMSSIIAMRGQGNDLAAKRSAALQLEANKFGAVPYSTLGTWSTADQTFTRGDFTYTRKLTISAPTSTRYMIQIVVVPASDPTRTDSIALDRTLPPSGTPLCAGC